MPLLDRGAILDIAEQGYKTTAVDVPEWGTNLQVRVRELSAEEYQQVSGEMMDQEGAEATVRAMRYIYDVVVWCAIDDEGAPLFDEPGDKAQLIERGKTSTFYQGLGRVANAALALSGLTTEDDEVEDEEKN